MTDAALKPETTEESRPVRKLAARPAAMSVAVAAQQPAASAILAAANGRGEAQERLDAFGIEAVCDLIHAGHGIRKIARAAGVGSGSLVRWLADPERSARARQARAATGWHWDDEAERVLKKAPSDPQEIARSRELAQHYRWRAKSLQPAVYGDKHLHTGADGESPVQVQVSLDYGRLTLEQLETLRTLTAVAAGEAPNPLGTVIDGELVAAVRDEAE